MCADCPDRLARDLEGAFPEFLAHHQDLVFGVALRMTKLPADAEELAQDAFVRAYRALQGYEAERIRALRSRGWLAAIVGNLGRNRARRRRPVESAVALALQVADEDGLRPDRALDRREADSDWRRRLEALPPRYARAVALRHVDGLSYPELAEALGRPLNTVKSDVHRGVDMLRQALLEERPKEAVGR